MTIDSPQLFLRRDTLDDLPPFALPAGFSLHSEREGDEAVWEALIERAFGSHYSFEKCVREKDGYRPDGVLFIALDGKEIATATAAEQATWFPGEGWLRMVGSDPAVRGRGAGRLACLAALHFLAAHGYKSAVLSTDDHRLPAISLYRSLGFCPLLLREDHAERWKRVDELLGERLKKGS